MSDVVRATDSYLNMLLSLPDLSALTVLAAFLLTIARIVPSMVLAPFFGAKNLPASVRIGFSIAIAAIFLPQILLSLHHQEIFFSLKFIWLFIKEIFIGFLLAFLVTIPFYIAQSSGGLIDHIRGASSLQVTDPTTSTQTGPIGLFYNYVLIFVFYVIGGPFLYLEALAKSFFLFPLQSGFSPAFFQIQLPFWQKLVGLLHYIFSIAIQLGAPSIIGVLMAEMFLGIANRLAPQVQIVFLGISLKSWVGLALLAASWYLVINQLGKESLLWLDYVQKAFDHAAYYKSAAS